MLSRTLTILAVVAVGCSGQPRELLHPTDPATDFHLVSPGIYRGGRLDEGGVLKLQTLGIKTIVNLEDDDDQIALEAKWAKAASITQISSPMSGFWAPDDHQVDRLLKLLADSSKRPIYVHCTKGMDRTGVVIALHRVYNEGWPTRRARAERDAIGFNHWLGKLDRYYAWKAARFKPLLAGSGGSGAAVAAARAAR